MKDNQLNTISLNTIALMFVLGAIGCEDEIATRVDDEPDAALGAPDSGAHEEDMQPDAPAELDMPLVEDLPADAPVEEPLTYRGPTLCDPTAPPALAPLRFYYYVDGDNPSHEDMIRIENGYVYLMLDEACNYLIYTSKEPDGQWSDVRQGRLTAQDVEAMETSLAGIDWDALNGTVDMELGSYFHLSTRMFKVGDYSLGFVCDQCDAHGAAMRRFSEWFLELDARSAVYVPAALRVQVMSVEPDDEQRIHIPIQQLSIDLGLAAHARSQYDERVCPGDGLLVEDRAAVRTLRGLRAFYLERYHLTAHGGIPVRDVDGRVYKLLFRSVTRFDGPDGPTEFVDSAAAITRCRLERMLFP